MERNERTYHETIVDHYFRGLTTPNQLQQWLGLIETRHDVISALDLKMPLYGFNNDLRLWMDTFREGFEDDASFKKALRKEIIVLDELLAVNNISFYEYNDFVKALQNAIYGERYVQEKDFKVKTDTAERHIRRWALNKMEELKEEKERLQKYRALLEAELKYLRGEGVILTRGADDHVSIDGTAIDEAVLYAFVNERTKTYFVITSRQELGDNDVWLYAGKEGEPLPYAKKTAENKDKEPFGKITYTYLWEEKERQLTIPYPSHESTPLSDHEGEEEELKRLYIRQ